MRVAVIGGTGHIGTYLCPALLQEEHVVVSISRGARRPYIDHPAWKDIEQVTLDRTAEGAAGTFGSRIAELQADAVVDLTCYTPESAADLCQALSGRVQHFLHCGTIWIHGHSVEVPTTEDMPRKPFGDYGCRKVAIEALLLRRFAEERFPVTLIHPGHLVGKGWAPINPVGNLNLDVFTRLSSGGEVLLPNGGMETLHHVHAGDVAQAFVRALATPERAIGQCFHAVSPKAITMRGYAEAVAGWFGREPNLRLVPWTDWQAQANEKDARITLDHMRHSPNCSIDKARELLAFEPQYTSLQAVREAVDWQISKGYLTVS